ncbi:inhibin alpha chain [Anomaloglossus baeobatrachus]|uniref:inhibin alpha chain n=1 Tax=Anomaloglossus baeobatrachus TaxID=238106 RepID=UPI003F5092CA
MQKLCRRTEPSETSAGADTSRDRQLLSFPSKRDDIPNARAELRHERRWDSARDISYKKQKETTLRPNIWFTLDHKTSSMAPAFVLFCAVMVAQICRGCEMPEADRQVILDKVKTRIVEALGSPPPTTDASPAPSPNPNGPIKFEERILRKRHSQARGHSLEDTSKVILFPSSDILCETPSLDTPMAEGNSFTYIFRPSPHILSRRVSSVQFWFFTGESSTGKFTWYENLSTEDTSDQTTEQPSIVAEASTHESHTIGDDSVDDKEDSVSPVNSTTKEKTLHHVVDIQVLSQQKPVTVATSKVEKMEDWTVFHLAPAFLNYVASSLFVLLVNCPTCRCSDHPEHTPFLMYSTRPNQRGRRSGVPWSPSALELLQRPPAPGADTTQCHRGSLNISFEELGWNQWIVHPGSFQFHYCHGTCSPNHGLSTALHWGNCCAALPSTMKPLRVTTTTDGGFSFRYETVPNLLTQDCACS